ARVWLRRVGSPAALHLAIHQDAGGAPGAPLAQAHSSLNAAELEDVVSVFHDFELAEFTGDLATAQEYHLVFSAAAQDNAANHWEIGVHVRHPGGHASAGAGWGPAGFCAYSRVEDAGLKRNFRFFEFNGCLYAVDQRAGGDASHLYLNGDRGLATGWGAAALEDADKAWQPGVWAGAWLRIHRGAGAGQARQVVANSATELTLAAPWAQPPGAASEYILYATDIWQDVSPISGAQFDVPVSDLAVFHDQVYFARGTDQPILRMRYNPALNPPAHQFADDASSADHLHAFHHAQFGPQLWRGLAAANTVSRAAPAAWGTPLSFGTAIPLGSSDAGLLALFDRQEQLWALKSDGLWRVGADDRAQHLNLGLNSLPNPQPRPPLAQLGGELWLGWGAHLLRQEGAELAAESPQGLPAGRNGLPAALQPLGPGRLAVALDAGESGQSSLLLNAGGTWHELLRAPGLGQRIQSLHLEGAPGVRPRLWLALGGDLACVELPRDTAAPLGDAGLAYQHEAVLVGGSIDMGAARLPKYLRSLSLLSRHLGAGVQVHLDVQLDGEIGGGRWRSLGAFYSSPMDSLPLNLGQLYTLRPRLRLLTNRATLPPVVLASQLEGFARTPLRYRWTLKLRLDAVQHDRRGGLDPTPQDFVAWLQAAARQARKIHMRSVWADLDGKDVLVEPPALQRERSAGDGGWGGTLTLVLREG
ncbi:MAG: hypothetical protein KIS85_08440, partial [Anaerolineales bacterium]|nr:hypothetical protein [Anaerolineales bacterium]